MKNGFYMECPSFGEALAPAAGQELTLATRNGRPARDYSHPIDGQIVKILDMPLINGVFKTFVDTMVDANYGQMLASGIPVTEQSFPGINEIVERCARTLHIRKPYVVVSESMKFNAATIGSDEEPYIILGSLLTAALTPEQLLFVIGHECGHIAMGHVVYHSALSMAGGLANAIPIVGPTVYNISFFALKAWSRRSEITADRAGLLCCGSLDVGCRTLMQLQMGLLHSQNMDTKEYVESSRRYRAGGVLRNLGEYLQKHPLLPKRIEALQAFANSELYYDVTGRSAPEGVISQTQLNKRVEEIISVM